MTPSSRWMDRARHWPGRWIARVRSAAVRVEGAWDRRRSRRRWKRGFERLKVLAYRGYAGDHRLVLMGRVLDDALAGAPELGQSVWENLRATWRRLETDEVWGARVRLALEDRVEEAVTDQDGFFRFDLALRRPLEGPTVRELPLEIVHPRREPPVGTRALIHVPPPGCDFVVASDLDDTVIRTGATSKPVHMSVVLLNNARSHTPFEHLGPFYQALQAGPRGEGANPVLYVSSSPWNLYGLFQEFLEAHDIPAGPMFLKDYGLGQEHFLSSGHRSHKLEAIRTLMEAWPHLPFVLIGDSGQQDPEIYAELARASPQRVRAVLIRDVTGGRRSRRVRDLTREVAEHGVPMVLAADTTAAWAAARDLGLVASGPAGGIPAVDSTFPNG